MPSYANVIIPLPVPNTFSYSIPEDLKGHAQVGCRVAVQFGKSKIYTGIIESINPIAPSAYQAKEILSVLDETPVVNSFQLKFWKWMSDYYMATIGETMRASLPSGLKLESESKVVLNTEITIEDSILSHDEYIIKEALEIQPSLSLEDISLILHKKIIMPIIKKMIDKNIVMMEEELNERYKPKTEFFVSLHQDMAIEENLKNAFNKLSKAPKQLQTLMFLLNEKNKGLLEIRRPNLLKSLEIPSSSLNTLVKKNIIEINEHEVDRLLSIGDEIQEFNVLNEHQEKALKEVRESFESKDVVLLNGVTGSGKTEIYIKLIEDALARKKQVLYLLPEIALTSQIINRLRKFFGDEIGVYHSKFNANEKIEVWNGVLTAARFNIIIGARSSIFLPFQNLGLIIIDEENDTSFKQYNPAPRYNARDSAIYLGNLHKAKILLGTATPAIETTYNALKGKYGYVELLKRYGNIQMPEILVVDTKEAKRKKRMKSIFTEFLLEHIDKAFENNEQVILFQNRKGFSPFLECQTCNWIPQCRNCDVNLTYYKIKHELKCHYCGFTANVPRTCSSCGHTDVKVMGFGTEKVEEELALLYPEIKIKRMDYNSTRTKHAHAEIIQEFEEGKINVLVGTQMVTKGLDFDHVSVVGILDADNMLNFQDFRAHERSFQLMSQVSGRAGRKNKRGKVIIQTGNPTHYVIQDVIANNYMNLYENELLDRKSFKYPPFYRLVDITLKHKSQELLNEASSSFAKALREKFSDRILGPEFPIIPRVKNFFHKKILVKIEKEASLSKAKKVLMETIIDFNIHSEYRAVKITIDVDPL